MKIYIKKLVELPDALRPGNIDVGFEREFVMHEKDFSPPVVGECFFPTYHWGTSEVQEIIDDKTFRTYNSIYQWVIY